jgi:hypothetical protein
MDGKTGLDGRRTLAGRPLARGMSVELLLIERKALLEPLIANKPGLQFNGHEIGDGDLILNANLVERRRVLKAARRVG